MNIVIHSLNKQAARWDYINISILPRQAKMKRISISDEYRHSLFEQTGSEVGLH